MVEPSPAGTSQIPGLSELIVWCEIRHSGFIYTGIELARFPDIWTRKMGLFVPCAGRSVPAYRASSDTRMTGRRGA